MKLAACLASALLLSLASTATAQSSSNSSRREPAAYTEAIREAVSEFELGDFTEAREQFSKAHAIDPNGRTFRGLGVVEFELRHYTESVKLLEQALAATNKPLDGKLRADTQKALERAQAYVGSVQVEIDPPGASVVVDGEEVQLDEASTLQLDVGDHIFEFHADGRLSTRQTVSVKGAKTETVHVVLRPLLEVATPAPASPALDLKTPPPAEAEGQPLYKKWWLWTAVGVVVAAGVTTGVVLLTRDTSERTVPTVTSHTPPGATISTLTLGQ